MNRPQRLASAARFVVEQLEGRRLLAFTGVNFDLPLQLTFDGESNGVQDVDGQNTGFPIVQGNADGNEYDSSLIDLDTDAGLLLVTSAGDAIDGSNFGTDNSLVNGLQLPFDGSADWLVYTKVGLSGDTLDGFDTAFEQAGIMVGPTQDNYVKLVFGHDGTQNTVQFLAEQPDGSGGLTFALGNGGATSLPAGQTGVDLSTARFVDLWLAGDASTGVISAQYRVEGGVMVRLPQTFTAPQTDFFRVNGNRAGLIAVHKNNGDAITAAFDEFAVTNDTLPGTQPVVLEARPNDGEELVDRGAFVAVDLFLPNASVAGATLDGNVTLTRVSDGLVVPATLNTTGGGDSIVVTPDRALDADTEYRFDVTAGVTDLLGVAFQPFSSTFATGFTLGTDAGVAGLADVAFEQVDLPDTVGTAWAGVTVGPDNRLYGLAVTGEIFRYNIASDGTLSNETLIDSLNDSEGEQRLATGLAFAPNATSSNLVAYITHTQLNPLSTNIPADLGDDFTGKITRLSGSNLQNAQTLVEGLPRSTRDHVTNQPVFGPDGLLYFVQASNSAMGAPDPAWGNRPERPLSGAVLAADVKALSQRSTPLDVTTPDGGGTYDPDVPGALVSVYAEGIRNAYDLVFHSNGRLYSPANGSAAGGNAPAGPGGFPPAINGVSNTQGDYLYDVIEGGYYGHPNPSQGNFVLSGGNPTAGVDPAEVPDYPVGTQPQNDYQGFAFDFGLNESPNGAVEYGLSGSGSFNGDLDGKLIVTRFSGSDDLIVLDVDETGGIRQGVTDIPGFDGFSNPLDLAEGPGGVLYVAQFGDREGEVPMVDPNTQRITLLRPVAAGGEASVDRRRIFIDAAANTSEERPLTVRNLGTEPLVVSPYTLGLTGPDKDLFEFVNAPTQATAVQPGEEISFTVRFNAPAGASDGDTFEALAFVRTSDPDAPEVGSSVTGVVKRGDGGANEPSLQQIFDYYDLGITTGDPDPTTTEITLSQLGGLSTQLFQPANPDKPVAIDVIASFSPDGNPVLSYGFYQPGRGEAQTKLGEVFTDQGLDPLVTGPDKFFPGGTFGLYAKSPAFGDVIGPGISDTRGRTAYSEAVLNIWEPTPGERDKVAVYEIPGVENALAVSFEEFEFADDYNDIVLVMTNVEPAAQAPGRLAVTSNGADEGLERLIFSEIDPAGQDPNAATQLTRQSRTFELANAGNSSLTVTGVTAPDGFAATNLVGTSLTPGQTAAFQIDFTATNEGSRQGIYEGDIVIEHTGGSFTLPVAGYWMPYSEDNSFSGMGSVNEEPILDDMIEILGLTTDVGTEAERLTGTSDPVGDEVISFYWQAAQQDLPVEVYQMAAFHNTGFADQIFWFPRDGSTSEATASANSVSIFQHDANAAQSFLPAIRNGTEPAAGTFEPGDEVFGFRVVNEYSVDDFNDDNFGSAGDDLHLFRFFPVKDSRGRIVEDTWLVTMDFTGFNFDYNDNVYIVKNIEPADQTPSPVGVTAQRNGSDATVYFAVPSEAERVAIFRSDNGGAFTQLTTLGGQGFFELDGVDDDTVLRITTLDATGNPGTFSEVRLV